MKGYIYTMYAGADPGAGWTMNDPIFGPTPTLGACVPHIRRAVDVGDHIFVISGRVNGMKQFIVGGMEVDKKISALAAHKKFPAYRLAEDAKGQVVGNIIVDGDGKHHRLDDHKNFKNRIENYIVGRNPVALTTEQQFKAAREGTAEILSDLFGKKGTKPFDFIGRHRKMDEKQVKQLILWLKDLAQ